MARQLIASYFFPAKDQERYVFFLNHPGGGGSHAELGFPTSLKESRTFLAVTNSAACQFKLTAGAVAKVEVYKLPGEEEHQRFHDVQIMNCSKFVGGKDVESVKAQFANLDLPEEDKTLNGPGIQGICSNTCGGTFYEIFDCPDILTMSLKCDTKECGSGGGG